MLGAGISDHHSLIITALKSQLVKGNAKTKVYRDYSEFNMDNFKAELDHKLKSGIVIGYTDFQSDCPYRLCKPYLQNIGFL